LFLLFPLLQPQRFARRRRSSRRYRLSCSAFVTLENLLVLLVCTVTVL
jgi:hypothetical protein